MTKVLDRGFTATVMVATMAFGSYMLIEGITRSAIAIAIIYVALVAFYAGYKYGIKKQMGQ